MVKGSCVICGKIIKRLKKIKCPKCNSRNITKRGFSDRVFEIKQRYECSDCSYRFLSEVDRLRIPKHIRRFILSCYKKKYSTREISKAIKKKFKVDFSNVAIYRMLKNTKRYFGKDISHKIVKIKRTLPSFKRVVNGKIIKHKRSKYNRRGIEII